jgi:hypothetical protein
LIRKDLTVSEKIEVKECCIFLSFPWQRQPYWNMSTFHAPIQVTLIIPVKFHHQRTNHPWENSRTKICWNFGTFLQFP